MDKSESMFALTNLKSGSELNYTNGFKNTDMFLVVISGTVKINNIVLQKRDGVAFLRQIVLRLLQTKIQNYLQLKFQ